MLISHPQWPRNKLIVWHVSSLRAPSSSVLRKTRKLTAPYGILHSWGSTIRAGLYFLFHPFFHEVLENLGIMAFQLHPNTWKQLVGMVILYHLKSFHVPWVRDFFYVYRVKSNPFEYGFYYIAKDPHIGISLIEGAKSNIGQWLPCFWFARKINRERGPFHEASRFYI